MHELSLFGQVPQARHEQVLNILAGLSAMQPQALYERHLIYRTLRIDQAKQNKRNPSKPLQQQTPSYQLLVQSLTEEQFKGEHADHAAWTLRIQDVPEPETKTLILRKVTEFEVTGAELESYSDAANYSYINGYVVEGHRLICGNVVLQLIRILRFAPDQSQQDPRSALVHLESLTPVDSSGAFMLEACVRIDDRTKPSLVQAATDELLWFRNEMKGSVDLRAPERLALDTRVKGA